MPARVIDAHQHFWRLDRGDYGWITPDLAAIHRDFGPGDLARLLAAAGIGETILVQAAPTAAETRFLCHTAWATSFVAGVVGWADLAAPDAPDAIARLAEDASLVGIRPMIHDIPDPDWMLGPALEPAFRALIELDLTFDALVRPLHLPNLRVLLARHPDLRVVIDHGGKPDVAGWGRSREAHAAWAEAMQALACATTAACKLSGLVTEAGPGWRVGDLQPYVEHLLECFGADRVIWGSDWPVVDLAGGYAAWWDATQACLAGVSVDEQAKIFGGNAARYYDV